MQQPVNMTARFLFIGFIWTLIAAMVFTFSSREALDDGVIAMGITMIVGAIILSARLLHGIGRPPMVEQHAAAVRKRENDQNRGDVDPMSLLTDDDIAELRAELKDRLRLKMLEGDAEALTSFEALLADRQQRKRK